MKPLSASDFAGLQRAILALHSHRDLESFRRGVPGIFMDLIPADYFSLVDSRLDFEQESVQLLDIWESRPSPLSVDLRALEPHLYEHPFTRHARKHGVNGAMILSDFLTLPQLRKTQLYRDALKPANIGRVLAIGSFGGPGRATLSLTRPETEPDFTERDRRILETLRPHFDQARENLERETKFRASRSRSLRARGITPRETEVALWLARGKSNPEIAAILATPVRTIEKHVERILRKLGVENRAAAAVTVAEIVRA